MEKDNYRPISFLSNISKIYERIMHNPINDFFINKLYKCQCGFRKWFGALFFSNDKKTSENPRQ